MKKQILIFALLGCLLFAACAKEELPAVSSEAESSTESTAETENESIDLAALHRVTENGIEVVDAEKLSALRDVLAGEKPFLTEEKVMLLPETVEAIYEQGTTWVFPALDERASIEPEMDSHSETVTIAKTLMPEQASLNQKMGVRNKMCAEYNRILAYMLAALTPAEYTFFAYEVEPGAVYNAYGPEFTRYYVLAGAYSSPEEALVLLKENADNIEYITCTTENVMYYHNGSESRRLSQDYTDFEEYIAFKNRQNGSAATE